MGVLVKNGKVRTSGGRVRTGPAGSPCCCGSRQARLCSDDTLQDVWMSQANAATLPGAFSIGSTCYYFDFNDPVSNSPGTIYTPANVTAFDSCEECDGDPCDPGAPIDYSCENLRITYTRKVEEFFGNTTCSGSPDTTSTTAQDRVLVLNGLGGGGIVGTCLCDGQYWVDDQGEVALQLCCPDGWTVYFTDPNNISCCASVRGLDGLAPEAPLNGYPDVVCCQEVPSEPNYSQRVTYTNITVVCDDVP